MDKRDGLPEKLSVCPNHSVGESRGGTFEKVRFLTGLPQDTVNFRHNNICIVSYLSTPTNKTVLVCVHHTVNYTNICFIDAFKKDKHLRQIKDYIHIYIYA